MLLGVKKSRFLIFPAKEDSRGGARTVSMTDPDRDRLLDEHAGPHAGLIEEADKVGAAGSTKTKHARRIIPVERIAPEADLDAL